MKKIRTVITALMLIGIGIGVFFIISLPVINKLDAGEFISEKIKLPATKYDSKTSVEKALLERRSIRDFTNEPLTLPEISQILWAAQGITASGGFRTAPSAGALYPLELYVAAGNVSNLQSGIYKYIPQSHELLRIVKGDRRTELCKAALGQSAIKDAPAIIVLSAVYERTTGKYGERGIRYVHIEIGHAAQNVYLQAVSLNLGTVVIGAFDDDRVKKVMNMEDKERPLYLMPVGKTFGKAPH
jgi:SagB-type dehydrogenase family enzyme